MLIEFGQVDEMEEPLCIRFANTVSYRLGDSPSERLASPERLAQWLVRAGLAESEFPVSESFLGRAIRLREAIYHALANNAKTGAADLNREIHAALSKLSIENGQWKLSETDLVSAALHRIALSAATLLTSPLRDRVKLCGDSTCGWLFVDRSKNHSRRWCSMSDCGNLAKARRFQQRRRTERGAGM